MPLALLNSPAYLDLPHSARGALPLFMAKPKEPYMHQQRLAFREPFALSYGEAARFGYSTATWFKVVAALVRNGFLDPVQKGGFKGIGGKGFNLYKLSRRWEQYGSDGFEALEWRCFIPKPRPGSTSKREMHSVRLGNI